MSILNRSFASEKDQSTLSNPALDEFLFKLVMPQVQNDFVPLGLKPRPTRFAVMKQFIE